MLPPQRVLSSFVRRAATADIALVEGVMGLYDGSEYENDNGSTAEVAIAAAAPQTPVAQPVRKPKSRP